MPAGIIFARKASKLAVECPALVLEASQNSEQPFEQIAQDDIVWYGTADRLLEDLPLAGGQPQAEGLRQATYLIDHRRRHSDDALARRENRAHAVAVKGLDGDRFIPPTVN